MLVMYQQKLLIKQKTSSIWCDQINMVCVTLEGLWMVSDRIVDFRFIVKFYRSGPAIIYSY